MNSLGFLKVFLDLPLPLSFESVFLVANASSVLFIISQVVAHVMASGATFVFLLESSGVLRFYEVNSGALRSICYQFVLRCRVFQESIQFGLYGTRTFSLVFAHCVHSRL